MSGNLPPGKPGSLELLLQKIDQMMVELVEVKGMASSLQNLQTQTVKVLQALVAKENPMVDEILEAHGIILTDASGKQIFPRPKKIQASDGSWN